MFGSQSKPLSARIERWLPYLQQFQYELTHIPGKDNAADVLSCLPVGHAQDKDTVGTEDFAYSVVTEAMPAASTPKQVETASAEDPTLQLVCQALMSGDWSKLSGTSYKAVKDELSLVGQVVIRENRVVMPKSLWKKTITPDAIADPTNTATMRDVTLGDKVKHLIKFAENINGEWVYRFARHPRFAYWAFNMIQRHRCLSQGSIFLKQHPGEAQLTVEQLKQMLTSNSYSSLS